MTLYKYMTAKEKVRYLQFKKYKHEIHRLLEMMWPVYSHRYKYLAKKMGEGRHVHCTYMDEHEVLWALAILKNRAWRMEIESPEVVIL